MNLKTKVVNGIFWVTFTVVISRMLNFISKIVLARLLDPADFGLIAIAIMVINTLDLFTDLGIGTALIYKKDDSKYKAANTAFLLLPIVATCMFAIAYISAPHIAIFFNSVDAEPIIRILALTLLITSVGTVPSILLEKELEFKKKVIPELVPSILYIIIAIGLAYAGFGVWSLVYGRIVLSVSANILLWAVSSWRPTFQFDRALARELVGYGKHVLGASTVIFLFNNLDNAIVGRILGTEALGLYTMAYAIANLPATQITHLIVKVTFPAYSKLKDNPDSLRRTYLKSLKLVSFLSIPIAFGLFGISQDFVYVILGEKWMPAVPALQVLCLSGLMRSLGSISGSILQATGNPKYLFKISLLSVISLSLLILPLTKSLGIMGTGIAVVLSNSIGNILSLKKMLSVLDFNIKDYISILKPNFIATGISFSCVILLNQFMVQYNIISLLIKSGTFFLVYFLLIYLFERSFIIEFKNYIKIN